MFLIGTVQKILPDNLTSKRSKCYSDCKGRSKIISTSDECKIQNARLDEAQAGIKIARRNTNNLRYAGDITLMAKQRRTKEPLDESERRK